MLTQPQILNSKSNNCMTDKELRSILESLIEPKYYCHITDWLYYAKPNEKKGLYILSEVTKNRGEKTFKTNSKKNDEDRFDPNKLTLMDAFKRYQQK